MYDDEEDEAAILNVLGKLPDGPASRILDHCYNQINGATLERAIKNLNALEPEVILDLEAFMTDNYRASFHQRYAFVYQYIAALPPSELTVWIRVARRNVDAVIAELGCRAEQVIQSVSSLIGYRDYAAEFSSTMEQQRALFIFHVMLRLEDMRSKRVSERLVYSGYSQGSGCLKDMDLIRLISDYPERVKDIFEIVVGRRGKCSGIEARKMLESCAAPTLLEGAL